MSGTDLILMALVVIFLGSYISLLLWADSVNEQYVHNFYFPEDKEVNKQDETDNQKEE